MSSILSIIRVTIFGSGADGGIPFDPSRDIPSLKGKVILVTGGASGLGRQAAIGLARHNPASIYIADLPRADQGADAISAVQSEGSKVCVRFLELDLGSFASIQAAAAKLREAETRLDICVLNAGIMSATPGLTAEGYEIHFGINYLGHALLTKLLLPLLLTTADQPRADVRVVLVSSEGHMMAPRGGVIFEKLKTPCKEMNYYQRYGQSKLADIGFVRELARLYPSLKVVAVHPGRVATGIADRLKKESKFIGVLSRLAPLTLATAVEIGAHNHLWASTATNVQSGRYYVPVGALGKESALAKDENLSTRIWEWTANELKPFEGVQWH